MNLRHIIFILVYFFAAIISISTSSSVASEELSIASLPPSTPTVEVTAAEPVARETEKSESQIELPPLSTPAKIDDKAPHANNGDAGENGDRSDEGAATTHSATEQAKALDAKITDNNKERRTQRRDSDDENASEIDESDGGSVVVDEEKELTERQESESAREEEEKEKGANSSEDEINSPESIQENLTIPVFSEWTQQQQEAEKKLVELSSNSTESNKEVKNETVLAKHQIVKMRQKNYALPDCGAKILASNPEAQSASSVLSDKDEYMLSPCTDRIWFVVELCDSIQAQRVELANFELFSSPLKSVSISLSNRFPTREWTIAGHFDAKSERGVQNFDLRDVTLFGKFVRVDLEYTNTEHYCPLSFFRIFGTSEIEAFEVENDPENRPLNHEDDDDEFMHGQSQHKTDTTKDNILNRAGAAVLSIVQKAAEVLVKSNGSGAKQNATSSKNFDEKCISLSHNIVCETCSSDERLNLNNLISCKNAALSNLLQANVKNHLINSISCNRILGFNLHSDSDETDRNFIASILPQKYIAAMCNIVAGDQSKLTLRAEDISDIAASLISKKDEVSLKNISKKTENGQCKQSTQVETPLPTEVKTDSAKEPPPASGSPKPSEESNENPLSNEEKSNSTEEQNIFNRIERQPFIENEPDETTTTATNSQPKAETPNVIEPVVVTTPFEEGSASAILREDKKETIPKVDPQSSKINSEARQQQQQNKASDQDAKNQLGGGEARINQSGEIKPNSDQRVITTPTPSLSSAPESVFLRLSNRIKILEKNMTLSTQYLEELSRRYKKQIEDLQQSYAKLQTQYDSLNQSRREGEKRDVQEKRQIREEVAELDTKSYYMEIILIVLTIFLVLQSILIFILFKRLSILRDVFVMNEDRALIQKGTEDSDVMGGQQVTSVDTLLNEKTSGSRTTGRKRSKQRVRKISAPNILSRQNGHSHNGKANEFVSLPPGLNRTSSAPHKVNEFVEMKENLPLMGQSAMLEENDEILIPNFGDLRIKDEEEDIMMTATAAAARSERSLPKTKSRSDDDTASTASVKTTDDQNSNSSFNLARRLSSPTQFLKLKKTTKMKVKNGRAVNAHNHVQPKKAKSESPPKISSSSSNFIHKSNSFQADGESRSDDSLKFRKNNSFKKLFKKLF